MKPIAVIVAFLMLLTALPALAHDGVKDKKQEEGKRRGDLLKPGEGEKHGPLRSIKDGDGMIVRPVVFVY